MSEDRLCGIQLFQFNKEENLEPEAKKGDCPVCLLKIACGPNIGWGECALITDGRSVDLSVWGSFLQQLKKLTIAEALELLEQERPHWGETKTELVRKALTEIVLHRGQQLDVSALLARCRAYYSVV
ncbi:hypothetical protein ACFPVX_23585 [Cohnella faecalis]|uniref:Uncharacterized protein n=1 Tax=Cohnella faecalis TaxID=2315694 RepID=A0A398CG28_9BACL|nr:hypothetical protein [Cohnella faecalis]RIE02166.1 hypothetical protein D3H35_15575 [Cohnella faecalis]